MVKKICAIALLCVLFAACGGGGGGGREGSVSFGPPGTGNGGTFPIYLSYPSEIRLFEKVAIHPYQGESGGRSPRCSLVSGDPPPGLSLRDDCALVGRALQPGKFLLTVRVEVDGAGSIVTNVYPTVAEPLAIYWDRSFPASAAIGQFVDELPQILWEAGSDVAATWNFRLVSGSLPPGLALDAGTGRICGAATASGAYSMEIQSRLTTQFGSYESVPRTHRINIAIPYIGYGRARYDLDPASGIRGNVAYISQAFSLAPSAGVFDPPVTYSNPTFSPALPSGLSADPENSVITGVPTGFSAHNEFEIQAIITSNGISAPTQGYMTLTVVSPTSFSYGWSQYTARAGVPFLLAPTVTQLSPVALSTNATIHYTLRSGDSLPAGLSLDPTTGAISGTPAGTGSFHPTIEVSVTNDSVSWVVPVSLHLIVE